MNYKEFIKLREAYDDYASDWETQDEMEEATKKALNSSKTDKHDDIKKIENKLNAAKKYQGTDDEIEQKKEAIKYIQNNLDAIKTFAKDNNALDEYKKLEKVVNERKTFSFKSFISEDLKNLEDKSDEEIDKIFSNLYSIFKDITKKNKDDADNDIEQLNSFFDLAKQVDTDDFDKVKDELVKASEQLSRQDGDNQLGYLIFNNPQNINKYSLIIALSNMIGNKIFKNNSAIFSGYKNSEYFKKAIENWFNISKDGTKKIYSLKPELEKPAEFIESAINSIAVSNDDIKELLSKYNKGDIKNALLKLGKEYESLNHHNLSKEKIENFNKIYGEIKNDPAGIEEPKEDSKIFNTGNIKKYSNSYFGFTTPVPDSFPREAEKSSVINNYYKELKAEALKHLEKISFTAQKQIKDVSKIKHDDLYWENNKVVDKVIKEWLFKGAKDFDNPTQGKQRIKNLTGSHAKTEPGQEEQKNIGKYDEKIDKIIKKDSNEAQGLYMNAMGRISTHMRRSFNLQIYNILKGTKEKLHKLENQLTKEIKGGLIRQAQVKAADKKKNGSSAKDANKREFDNAEKEGQISEYTSTIRAFLLSPYKDQTTEIAKWVLAKIITLADSPRDAKEILNNKFDAIGNKLGGSFHNGKVYDIKSANVMDKEAIAHFKGTVNESYDSAKDLLKNKGLGPDVTILDDINVLKKLRKELTDLKMDKELKELVNDMKAFFAKRAEIQEALKTLSGATSPAVSINTEEYVKKLSESIFNKNGYVGMIWEADDNLTTAMDTQKADNAQTLESFFGDPKNGVYTSDTFTNMFGTEGNNSDKIEIKGGKGPEDIAFLQQLADVRCCIVNYNNKYYFMSETAFENYKKLKVKQNNAEQETNQETEKQATDANQKHQMADMQKKQFEQATKQHGELNDGNNSFEENNAAVKYLTDQANLRSDSVNTEPKATVTTGAVGDVTIPQRLPTSQDVIKRKLNYTTYTYKNGPITVQKRKYDD